MNTVSPLLPLDSADSISASRRVYLFLRQRIIDMELLPGVKIVEKEIAQELGTSRTPVHEAVQRLAEDGLIEVLPRVGTFVARIPLDKLDDATLVRSALETAIIEKAAERITSEGIAKLRSILEWQAECIRNNDYRGFHRSDEDFHSTLAELSGYPGVWPVILQAKTQIDRYRQLTLPMEGRMDQVLVDHNEVLTAVASGDPARAVKAMHAHLAHLLPLLEITRNLRPEYFTAQLWNKNQR